VYNAEMLTLSCEFFGGFHKSFLWINQKNPKKHKNTKISHVPYGAQNLEFLGKFHGGAKSTWI
jgi:hypothetical protein